MQSLANNVQALANADKLNRRGKILDWLSPDGFDSRHDEFRKERAENSGQWFLNSDAFKNWASWSGPSRLVCTGIRMLLQVGFSNC